jgi:hypothetical protein
MNNPPYDHEIHAIECVDASITEWVHLNLGEKQ